MPTVEEDVAFGPLNMGLEQQEVERRVRIALERVGMEGLGKRAPFQLSGGQKKSIALATILSMEPDILVMDEPTSELDLVARRKVADVISSFDHTCLIATHDLELAKELCRRSILVEHGKVILDGATEEVVEQFIRRYQG